MIAIDLGSNTIRFLAATSGGEPLWEAQSVVRTAENLVHTGVIGSAAIARIAEAISGAKASFDFAGHEIAAVATEAFRQAHNREAAIVTLRDQTGIEFRIISAKTEAHLTANAVAKAAEQFGFSAPFIVIDIGGASSEAVYFDSEAKRFVSLPIGIVTLFERSLNAIETERFLEQELGALDDFVCAFGEFAQPKTVAATAGVPTTLAAIKLGLTFDRYDKKIVNGTQLTIDEIDKLHARLRSLQKTELDLLTGKNRGDLILCGAAILRHFIVRLGVEAIAVFDEGLREGVLQEALRA
ncbi:hypothetical protein AGMMS50229_07670 [Campylobacterota bacterium]|nr:hypothetical protein AGMMS50229_07670 [Campylobacterota bacterium]